MTGRAPITLLGATLLLAAPTAHAQQVTGGRTVTSTAGRVGERQTREEATIGNEPMARVDSRIQNRIQSRLRTRIDRDYNPETDAMLPFQAATDRPRTAGRVRRP